MTFLELFEQLKAQQKADAEVKKEEKKTFTLEEAKAFLENLKNWSCEHGKDQ